MREPDAFTVGHEDAGVLRLGQRRARISLFRQRLDDDGGRRARERGCGKGRASPDLGQPGHACRDELLHASRHRKRVAG